MHTATAHERPTLPEPGYTWYESKADAFAPATHETHMKNVRIKNSGKPAPDQNRTLSDELRRFLVTLYQNINTMKPCPNSIPHP